MLSHIKRIEIEINGYCNRECHWCPNKDIQRDKNLPMPEDTFLKLIQDLKKNNFNKNKNKIFNKISFNRFSEPMADIKLLKKRSNQLKNILDNVYLYVNTNGDFLNKKNISNLNLDRINVMDYDCRGTAYGFELINNLGLKVRRFDTENKYISARDDNSFELRYFYNWPLNNNIENIAELLDIENKIKIKDPHNHEYKNIEWHSNRKSRQRNKKCIEIFNYISIDYNGNVMPCCHMRSDAKKHEDFILGNINEKSISNIYYSKKSKKFRNIMLGKIDDYPKICKRCHKYRDNEEIKNIKECW